MAYTQPPSAVTPIGAARFPHLNTPDAKFKADNPVYKTHLVVSEAQGRALADRVEGMLDRLMEGDPEMVALLPKDAREPFLAKLKNTRDFAAGDAKAGKKPMLVRAAPPSVVADTDEDENETGDLVFKMSANSKRKDFKSGQMVDRPKLALKDSANRPTNVLITGGSLIRCKITMSPWANPKGECGIKLSLDGVQVIEIRGSAGADFDTVEDGFRDSGESAPSQAASTPSNASPDDLDDEIPF